ncbi:MAG: hypothetical protein WAO09_10315 [Candidatus Dormiibacterota bacterium]
MDNLVTPEATKLSLVVGGAAHVEDVSHTQNLEEFLHVDSVAPSAIVQHIGFDKIESELARIGAELDRLLAAVPRPSGSYELSSVQLSLGITANGGIGIVSAGVQAGLSLTFSPKGS